MDSSDAPVRHDHPHSTAQIGGHPIHPMLIPFPITCLVGTLVSDLLYMAYGDPGFATASRWLLGFGIATALLAAVFGLIDYMGDDRIRRLGVALQHMIANVTAVAVAAVNLAIRLDGDDNVLSIGIWLSAAVVAILLFSGWRGGDLVFRHGVGVRDRSSGGY